MPFQSYLSLCLINLPTILRSTEPITWRDNLQTNLFIPTVSYALFIKQTRKKYHPTKVNCKCIPNWNVKDPVIQCTMFPVGCRVAKEYSLTNPFARAKHVLLVLIKLWQYEICIAGVVRLKMFVYCGTTFWYWWSNANAFMCISTPTHL